METMAVEQLVAGLWELDGYVTKTRLALRKKGGYSDIDVVGIRSGAGGVDVRLAEVKAQGEATNIFIIPDATYAEWYEKHWLGFVGQLGHLFTPEDTCLALNRKSILSCEIWLCSTFYFATLLSGEK